jgi:polyhydroxyalkanoate synthesis regulator phasin
MAGPQEGTQTMTYATRFDARREQMLRELASDLADMVETGDMTADQANEWHAAKADQWAREG